jgi:hypothetical protein
MQFCGQTLVHALHKIQNFSSLVDLLFIILIALQGQTSKHAWHDSPLHSAAS